MQGLRTQAMAGATELSGKVRYPIGGMDKRAHRQPRGLVRVWRWPVVRRSRPDD
jgi:hypothetical protein